MFLIKLKIVTSRTITDLVFSFAVEFCQTVGTVVGQSTVFFSATNANSRIL